MPLCRFAQIVVLMLACQNVANAKLRIFAAASLSDALNDIGIQWQQQGHDAPSLNFGGSATLAKQIQAGAPADVFISADQLWMNAVQSRGRILSTTRINLLGNELVLIAPKNKSFSLAMNAKVKTAAAAFTGKLCTGAVESVPAGMYAKQSLLKLGWWQALSRRIVGAEDVRMALTFVERGECGAGIVYATDAAMSTKVKVVGIFPSDSHQPIVYPIAVVPNKKTVNPEAIEFVKYLRHPAAKAIFMKYGFVWLGQA